MNKTLLKNKIAGLLLLAMVAIFVSYSCVEEEDYSPFYENDELLITSFLKESENLSELYNVLEYLDLADAFDVYGTYTFFAPDNNAFNEYYSLKGKSSYTDFDKEELKRVILYHVLSTSFTTEVLGEGTVPDTTFTGDLLGVDYSDSGQGISINKVSNITTKDIKLPNGIIHILDKVMEPIDYSVAKWVLGKKLDSIWSETSGGVAYRPWYTLFAVPDAVLAEDEINSFADLKAKLSPDADDYTNKYNGIYRWLAYHCMLKSYSLSDFSLEPAHFGTLSNQVLQVEVDRVEGVVKVNNELLEEEVVVDDITTLVEVEKWVSLDEQGSNNVAKNGVVHILSSMLEPVEFERVFRQFIFTDYPGIPFKELKDRGKIGREYWPTERNLDATTVDGIDAIPGLSLYADTEGMRANKIDYPFLRAHEYYDLTFHLPTILPGDYNVRFRYKSGNNTRATVQPFFDGTMFGPPVDMNTSTEGKNHTAYKDLGNIRLSTAKPHTFRLKCIKIGYSFLVGVEFIPIN
jgi:uncharacterized surface protein with fasciclin (FAS1) repeats